jgi:glycosyltransferase involved in cell wall biosynthesis
MPVPVSAFMITLNNERSAEKALKSLSWADEIIVVDSYSRDATPAIAREYASQFHQKEFSNFHDQYLFASSKCSHKWQIFLDADEELPAAIIEEMRAELEANEKRPEGERMAGFRARRRAFYLGRWIRHGGWVPDYKLRLFNKGHTGWDSGLHTEPLVRGKVKDLKNIFYHYTYEDISEHLETIQLYSNMEAEEMLKRGQRFSVVNMMGHVIGRFVRDYFLKLGFLDGLPGLIIAVNTAFYVFAKHSKLYEKEMKRRVAP